MRNRAFVALVAALSLCCSSSVKSEDPPPAGSDPGADPGAGHEVSDSAGAEPDTGPGCAYSGAHLVPGPCEEGFDEALAAKALRYERCWRIFNAGGIGLNTDVSVSIENAADRALIEDFISNKDGWEDELQELAGRPPLELLTAQHKVAGLYAGVGIVADAYRYGVLRDQGYPEAEVTRARGHLLAGLEGLHIAVAITGEPGVIARGLGRKSWNWGVELVPLKDGDGNPLPLEKNNGAWRADNSEGGLYPDYVWEDSCSRDQLIGWVAAFGAAWEVIGDDEQVPEAAKKTLQADARALGHALKKVRERGYDLEVPDADGRITLHGWLHEHNLDGKAYVDTFENGFHAVMALGIVASYAYAAEDPELSGWLREDLVEARELPRIAKEQVALLCDGGVGTNFSNVNMAMMGFWLALRYIEDGETRATLREGLRDSLYARPGKSFQPRDHHYSFYDFTYAASVGDTSASGASGSADTEALASGLETLKAFREPPYWDEKVQNCPVYEPIRCKEQRSETGSCSWDEEALAEPCTGVDGVTKLTPIGCAGWKCTPVVDAAVPWELQVPSNYHWRSAPHQANGGGDGSRMMPGVDFRFAYWTGRWTSLAPR
jgi:hypothetical protein